MEDDNESEEENVENYGRSTLLYDQSYFNGLANGRLLSQEPIYEQLIAPLPQKPLKEGEEQPVLEPIVCVNSFTVNEIC
jgi:hypothetical protein